MSTLQGKLVKPVVVWNVTQRCNLKCIHCYAQANCAQASDELSTKEGKQKAVLTVENHADGIYLYLRLLRENSERAKSTHKLLEISELGDWNYITINTNNMAYLKTRMRRLRNQEHMRKMIRETSLSLDDLIYPLFVCTGEHVKREITSMPGNYQLSIDCVLEECRELMDLGIKAILLFGIPDKKDMDGSLSSADDGIVQKAVRAIKKELPEMYVISDVCLCEYTSHGHCGILVNQQIDNDATVDVLASQALSHARAGVDMVAPSDMMDGRVGIIRRHLDENGFYDLPMMSYAAKYASAFYAPFREAAASAPKFGDRKSYQMDYCNAREAMREIALDIEEGADIVMVKPAMAYLDIIYRASMQFQVPIAAYHVSGEFSMIKAAAQNQWIDEQDVMMESMYAMKRAGANIIITYFAKEIARLLQT